MEFIIDYSINKDEIDSKIESIEEPTLEPEIDPTIEPILDESQPMGVDKEQENEVVSPKIQMKKTRASKKQLDNLQRAREKAKESIKRNKQIKEEYLKQKEKEERGDLEYLTNQLMYYQDKVNEKMKLLNQKPPSNDKYKIHKPTDLDILFDKFF